ncbi:MAG: hypothetical protein KBT34_10005 [Prevotella sp.]|nr:hypothetical protein [Candidatus Prevotella equi]
MNRFHVYVKQSEGESINNLTIVDLIPEGRENAISREMLLAKCIELDICYNDRAMRQLIEREKKEFVILAREGGGYYRPTHDDMLDLNRYIRQETHRAISVFRNIKRAKALYEDFRRGIM